MSQKPVEEAPGVSGQANTPLTAPAHALAFEQVAEQLNANVEDGLTNEEAKKRLEQYSHNEFGEQEGVKPLKIFIGQIANALTLVLILAMAASFGIQSWIEGGVVAAVIALLYQGLLGI